MNTKKVTVPGRSPAGEQGIIPDLSNIETNVAAQEYLKRRIQEISPEQLFEEIYQNRQDRGAEMMRRRAMRRVHDQKHGVADGPSLLDSPEKELAAYDRLAKEDTLAAMAWLRKAELLEEEAQKTVGRHKLRSLRQ